MVGHGWYHGHATKESNGVTPCGNGSGSHVSSETSDHTASTTLKPGSEQSQSSGTHGLEGVDVISCEAINHRRW